VRTLSPNEAANEKIWSRLSARRISLAVAGTALLLAAAAVLQAASAASARSPRTARLAPGTSR